MLFDVIRQLSAGYQVDLWQVLAQVLSVVFVILCILPLHEFAHGWVAYKLGDPTAKLNGRLTLNPIPHIDWVGLFLLLAVGVGWAKPVPVDPRNFKDPRKGMAITALAGPASNFLLALLSLAVGSLLIRLWPTSRLVAYLLLFLCQLSVLNVGLGLFNLIPVPPLDGSKVLGAVLPEDKYFGYMRYERYGALIMMVLLFTGVLDRPLAFLSDGLSDFFWLITEAVFRL